MTKPETALKNFAGKWAQGSWFLSDLTALISEHYYPKEFVEWAIRYVRLWDIGNQMEYTFVTKDGNIDSLPFDKLFNYWKENEQ